MLNSEINMIVDEVQRLQVMKLVEKYKEWYETYPVSISGKYHKSEPYMTAHIKRTVFFVDALCTEFNITGMDRDDLITAAILHDLGKTMCAIKGEYGQHFYKETGWSSLYEKDIHPQIGGLIIRETDLTRREKVANLVEKHMGHWLPKAPQPNNLNEYILCASDYLASRDEVKL